MRQIFPEQGPDFETVAALAGAYAYPVGQADVWVRANMVTSLDGAAQGPNGRSATVSSPPDRTVLALLRALADVILVGAGTARTERYGPAEVRPEFAEVRGERQWPAPPIAVVSRRLDLHPRLFPDGLTPRTIVLTVDSAPSDRRRELARVADVAVVGDVSVDIDAAIQALVERGLRRVLCEGGPRLLAAIVEAGRLDELCYTLTPRIVGGQSARMIETPRSLVSDWTLAHIIEDGGTLLSRWRRHR